MKKAVKMLALALALMMTLALCACGQEPATIEEDPTFTRGTVDGQAYTSEFAGLQYTAPEGWTYLSDEEIAKLNGITAAVGDEDFAAQLEENLESGMQVQDMQVMSTDGKSVSVVMAKMNGDGQTVDMAAFADATVEGMVSTYQSMGMEDAAATRGTVEIAGESCEAISLQGTLLNVLVYTKTACVQRGDYLCMITASTTTEDVTADMLAGFTALSK